VRRAGGTSNSQKPEMGFPPDSFHGGFKKTALIFG